MFVPSIRKRKPSRSPRRSSTSSRSRRKKQKIKHSYPRKRKPSRSLSRSRKRQKNFKTPSPQTPIVLSPYFGEKGEIKFDSPTRRTTIKEEQKGQVLDFNLFSTWKFLPSLIKSVKKHPEKRPIWYKLLDEKKSHVNRYRSFVEAGTNFIRNMETHKTKCFIGTNFNMDVNLQKILFFNEKYKKEYISIIKEKIKNDNIESIALFFTLKKKGISDHFTLCYVDKRSKVIEYYDSNGISSHNHDYNEVPRNIIKKFFYDDIGIEYDFLMFGDTIIKKDGTKIDIKTKKSFQSYEYHSKKYKELISRDGLCQMWSIYTLSLRLKYINTRSKLFQVKLYNTFLDIFKKNKEHINDNFAEFILEFMLYLSVNVSSDIFKK